MTSVAKTVREYPEPGITSADIADGTIATVDIADDAITFAKMQNLTTERLIGRTTAGTGDPEQIGVGLGGSLTLTALRLFRSALAGDVTAAADDNTTTIANDAVTFAKMANLATDRLIGRDTGGTGDPEAITVGGGLEFTGAGAIQSSAFTGDVTKAAGGVAQTIANDAVTYAKMQNVSAASRIIGRQSGSSGDPEELTADNGVTILSSVVTGPRRYSGTAASTVANTASETAFSQTYTIPANGLAAGTVFRISLYGIISCTGFSPTINLRIKLGGTLILDTALVTVNGLTDAGWSWIGQSTCFTAGGTGTVDSQGLAHFTTTVVPTPSTGTVTFDTTGTLAITVTAQWSAASATNSITLRNAMIEVF